MEKLVEKALEDSNRVSHKNSMCFETVRCDMNVFGAEATTYKSVFLLVNRKGDLGFVRTIAETYNNTFILLEEKIYELINNEWIKL